MIVPDEDGYATFASFRCPPCGGQVRDVIFIPDSSSVWRDEHGFSTEGEAEIMCGYCTSDFKLNVRNATGRVFAQVVGHPQVAVACTGATHRDELEILELPWEIENTPSDSLVDALKDVEEVIKTTDAIFYVRTLSRMAFIQQFAALEAYLSDTLTNRILDDPDALSRALTGLDNLKDIKLPLREVAANPDIVKTTVAKSLQALIFHNFPMVDAIWRVGFGFSIFPNQDVKQRMLVRVPLRHDCVHRNGKDKDGREHEKLDFDFVLQVSEDVHAMMMHIEDAFSPFIDDDPEALDRD